MAAEEQVMKRIMPHSVEAEQSVIGSMMIDRDAIVTASEMLLPDDFYGKQFGTLFEAIVELQESDGVVDVVTLQDKLSEKGVPMEINNMEYLGNLVAAVPTSANIKQYCQIVSEKALLRKMIRLNEDIANACYAGREETDVILEETEKKIFSLVQKRNSGDYIPIRDIVMEAMNKIEKASQTSGAVTGIPTGFLDLDYKLAGLQPSDLILVAARPSMGKTAFVLNILPFFPKQYTTFLNSCTDLFFSSI